MPKRRRRRPRVPLERVAEQREEEGEASKESQGEVTLKVPILDKTPVRKISGASNAGSNSRRASSVLDRPAVPGLQVRRRSRPLFATLGKRVSAMVKVRMAFGRKNHLEDVFEKDEEKMAAIHEMPKQPRFSSYLSPEAQYAMMKGYEDELYSRVVASHPEYRTLLRRNQTPLHLEGIRRRPPAHDHRAGAMTFGRERRPRVAISAGGGLDDLNDDDEEDEEEEDEEEKKKDEDEKKDEAGEGEANKGREEGESRPARRGGARLDRRKSHLPPVVPRERRLVLTYRMESAMDILDTLKRGKGHYVISPRVLRQSRPIVPIKDYHSWLQVWSKEFSANLRL